MKTPQELVEKVDRVKAGNQDAFADVYEESYKYLHTCVIHIVKNEDTAQDMLQDTYVEIYKNIGQLQSSADFLSWAATIANRKCFAYLKKNRDILLDEQTDDEGKETDFFESLADDEAFIPENIFDNKEKIKIIRDIIDNLSDVQRACVIGFYYNEQKQDEIAKELGVPVNTVKSHLNRAKAKIKEAVGDVEKKQGVKLYSFSPFMLMFLYYEIKAFAAKSAVPAMGAAITGAATAGKGIAAASAGKTAGSAAIKTAIAAAKTKIAIGATAAVVGASAVAGVAYVRSHQAPEEPVHEYEYIDVYVDEQAILDTVTVIDQPLSQVDREYIEHFLEEREAFFQNNYDTIHCEYNYEGGGRDWSEKGWDELVAKGPIRHKSVFYVIFTDDAHQDADHRICMSKYMYDDPFEITYEESEGANGFVYNGIIHEYEEGLMDVQFHAPVPFTIFWQDVYIDQNDPSKGIGKMIRAECFRTENYQKPKEFALAEVNPAQYLEELIPGVNEILSTNETIEFQNGTIWHKPDSAWWSFHFTGDDFLAKKYPRISIEADEDEQEIHRLWIYTF